MIKYLFSAPQIIYPFKINFKLPSFEWKPSKRYINHNTCRCCGNNELSWIWEDREIDNHFWPVANREISIINGLV